MASSSAMLHNLCSVSPYSPKCCNHNLTHSKFLSSKSFLRSKRKALSSDNKLSEAASPKPTVFALQSNFFKVVQTVWKVGKDGIEAGTDLVPDSVPRPIAMISVTVVALSVTLFVLKSFVSTAFFVLVVAAMALLLLVLPWFVNLFGDHHAIMGLAYFVFLALNKDQGPKGGGSTTTDTMDDPVEEARKIMDKYK